MHADFSPLSFYYYSYLSTLHCDEDIFRKSFPKAFIDFKLFSYTKTQHKSSKDYWSTWPKLAITYTHQARLTDMNGYLHNLLSIPNAQISKWWNLNINLLDFLVLYGSFNWMHSILNSLTTSSSKFEMLNTFFY